MGDANPEKRSLFLPSNHRVMKTPEGVWLDYAKEDLAVAGELVGDHDDIAAYHAHQAAEKGMKALQIQREGDHDQTHDLVRLYRHLNLPQEYQSVLENLNPADTAARYPDADKINLDKPAATIEKVAELLKWIEKQLTA